MQISLTNKLMQASPHVPATPSRGPAYTNDDGSRMRKPGWIRAKLPSGKGFQRMRAIVDEHALHTVCQSAACPNMGECWARGTATFMILGNICTRACGFCNVATGRPLGVDWDEPGRVAHAIELMAVKYAVITSVDRDDLPDKGSTIWANTIAETRRSSPETIIETLIPDYTGENLLRMLAAQPDDVDAIRSKHGVDGRGPDVLAHNLECVDRISKQVRAQAKPERSRQTLKEAKAAGFVTKTGVMMGLGETIDEVRELIRQSVDVGVDILTIGQYLQPSHQHLRIERWVEPQEFDELKAYALEVGIKACESGPMVRSSYYAENTGQEVLQLLGRYDETLKPIQPQPADGEGLATS